MATWHRVSRIVVTLAALAAGPLGGQVWSVGNRVVTLDVAQANAGFGKALAVGDFNGDTIDDFVVGAPYWSGSSAGYVGLWQVWLGATDRNLSPQNANSFVGPSDLDAAAALAAGDFDGDGRDEIAIGCPGADIMFSGSSRNAAGWVVVFEYEAGDWILSSNLDQNDTLPFSPPEEYDKFGEVLAVGNFNGDAYEDLAVGVPYEGWGGDAEVGAVHVYYGSASGLSKTGITSFLSASSAPAEDFGWQLASGDFDGDGYGELAVGIPFRTVDGKAKAGAVEIYSGSSGGLVTSAPQVLTDAALGGTVDTMDYFGGRLAAGNFNQSLFFCFLLGTTCYDDLAIGVYGQTVVFANAGKVKVAYGSAAGLATADATTLVQESLGISSQEGDTFGLGLAAGYLDRAFFSIADLAIGTPGKSWIPGRTWDGALDLAFGAGTGVNSAGGAQVMGQEPGFAIAPADDSDWWGDTMAIGDFDHDGWGDLLVGVRKKSVDGASQSGAVQILWGALFADGFESGDTTAW